MHSRLYAKLKSLRGFTLIELLIVIAIIGILTVAFLPTLRGGQASARNAARKATLNDLTIAIERIANGDIPTGVSLSTASPAGSIPLSPGGCLDFTVGRATTGADLALILGRNPVIQNTNTVTGMCAGGYFYKSFPTTGTANNYLLAVQVEQPVTNGNVSGGNLELDIRGSGLQAIGAFDTWDNVLTRTQGAPTVPIWVVTK